MLYTVKILYKFLWEVYFGKQTFKQAWKKNSKIVLLFIGFFIFLVYSGFSTYRNYSVSKQNIELKNAVEKEKLTSGTAITKAEDVVSNALSSTLKEEHEEIKELVASEINTPPELTNRPLTESEKEVLMRREDILEHLETLEGN